MSLGYKFKTGKHKGKTIKEVKSKDFAYLKSISKGDEKIKLTHNIKVFIDKMVEDNNALSTQLIDEVIQLYKDGYKRSEIIDLYVDKGYNADYISIVIEKAGGKIATNFEEEKQYLIGLHIKRYDNNYNQHMAAAESLIGPKNKWKRKDHYLLAMNSLVAKESLLGLHSKKYNIQLNNFVNKDAGDSTVAGYGFDALTTEELVELLELLGMAKIDIDGHSEIELFNESMVQATQTMKAVEEAIEDIEHEEVESPLSKVHHKNDYVEKVIEKREKTGNTLDTVKDEIRNSNKSAFELILKNKMKNG